MVTDEQILSGFANLHQVITTGFDAMRTEMAALRTELRAEIRTEISSLENRMMRRFDALDDRVDRLATDVHDHERRITALESKAPPS